MKHDIIKTDNYLLVVDESKTKGWYYDTYTNKVKHSGGAEYGENSITKNIISHLPLNCSPILAGVELLPPLGDDVEKSAHIRFIGSDDDVNYNLRFGFTEGYNKAKEKYKYTEEDIIRIVEKSRATGLTAEYLMLTLSQPKMPIGFECEIVPKKEGTIMQIPPCKHCIKPKTTTTPEGHTQWVGTYIY